MPPTIIVIIVSVSSSSKYAQGSVLGTMSVNKTTGKLTHRELVSPGLPGKGR